MSHATRKSLQQLLRNEAGFGEGGLYKSFYAAAVEESFPLPGRSLFMSSVAYECMVNSPLQEGYI